jgi:GxxExxY protein
MGEEGNQTTDFTDEHMVFLCYSISLWVDKLTTSSVQRYRFIGCWALDFWKPCTKKHFRLNWPNGEFPFSGEAEIPVVYKGRTLKTCYRSDFVCHNSIIAELKAISKHGDIEMAQVLNYLRATGFQKALLFNFGAGSFEKRRLVM